MVEPLVALAGHIVSNSAHLPSLLLMVLVALPGHVVSNSAHLPSWLPAMCPAKGTTAISKKEGTS